ncbi:MAG: metallophosphoesterase [Prolixibacteraceae bacterium]|jgi:3',5'-cyclic AMP phosphodiesterase CpdA|nr:metallophosphoesterase [Prolixibacteraceae bacterium]
MKTTKINRINYLFLLAALSVVFFACQQKAPRNNDSFSFVFMTDIHVEPENFATEGLLQAIDTINKLNPDFVITGGDNVADASNQKFGRADSLFNLYTKTMKSLKMPLHSGFGNHDTYSFIADLKPSQYKEMFEKRIGKTYYSFSYKNWKFIVLDPIMYGKGEHSYYGQIDSLQMIWLKHELDSIGKVSPIAVAMHVPLVSIGGENDRVNKENGQEIIRLFENYNVKLVLQGHLHMYEDILYHGIRYITGGAVCGGWWKGLLPDGRKMEEGFLQVKVDGNNFTTEYIDYRWEVKKSIAK